ncbi:GntR family transcriptional regulator, partial [Bacillus thuringiensis]
MTSSNTKVYLEIVKKIRSIMEEDGLVAGDRLPSERELSSRLNVGRSSVREALRALELVGLIETRRGEGTFIRNFYDNGLVQ